MLKRSTLLIVALAAVVFGTNMVAQAYPADGATVQVLSGSPGPVGSTFTVQVTDCLAGEDVSVNLPANGDGAVTATSAGTTGAGFVLSASQSGIATATLDHPSTPGTYNGTAELLTSDVTLSFTIVTTAAAAGGGGGDQPGASIPATGSNATTPTLWYGGAALAIGVAMLLIAANRRRPTPAQA